MVKLARSALESLHSEVSRVFTAWWLRRKLHHCEVSAECERKNGELARLAENYFRMQASSIKYRLEDMRK